MQQEFSDSPIAKEDSPYLNWARELEACQPKLKAGQALHSALVRLQNAGEGDGDGGAAALAQLTEAVFAGDLVLDAEDLDQLGLLADSDAAAVDLLDSFTVYWADGSVEAFVQRYGGMLEVLHMAKTIAAPRGVMALARVPKPKPLQGAKRGMSSRGPQPLRQAAPIVAVIDDGIGFLNSRFCRLSQATDAPYVTRFHAVWLQAFRAIADPVYGQAYVQAGQVLHRPDIDALLAQGKRLEPDAVYRRLNQQLLEPGAHPSLEYGFSHGTHIMDLAGGADPTSDDPALDWPLLAVQLPPEAVDNSAGTQLEPCIVQAVRWILQQARRINDHSPVIINISFATFAGPKDGTKAIEALVARALARFQAKTGRQARVVYAFGNARLTRQGAQMQLQPGSEQAIDWRLLPEDFTASYLELRPRNPSDMARLAVRLVPPQGRAAQSLGPLPPDMSRAIRDGAGQIIGRYYHIGARRTAPGVISPAYGVLAMAPSAAEKGQARTAAGGWKLLLTAQRGKALPLRLEVQRDDTPRGYRLNGRQSYLDHPLAYGWDPQSADYSLPEADCPMTRAGSHSSFVTAQSDAIYAVGAARQDQMRPSPYAAEGSGATRPSPSLAAVGDRGMALRGVLASGTYDGSGRVQSGSSVAAARVTRALAALFASGAQPAAGAAEIARLVQDYGVPVAPEFKSRLGAGVLTGPEAVGRA